MAMLCTRAPSPSLSKLGTLALLMRFLAVGALGRRMLGTAVLGAGQRDHLTVGRTYVVSAVWAGGKRSTGCRRFGAEGMGQHLGTGKDIYRWWKTMARFERYCLCTYGSGCQSYRS